MEIEWKTEMSEQDLREAWRSAIANKLLAALRGAGMHKACTEVEDMFLDAVPRKEWNRCNVYWEYPVGKQLHLVICGLRLRGRAEKFWRFLVAALSPSGIHVELFYYELQVHKKQRVRKT